MKFSDFRQSIGLRVGHGQVYQSKGRGPADMGGLPAPTWGSFPYYSLPPLSDTCKVFDSGQGQGIQNNDVSEPTPESFPLGICIVGSTERLGPPATLGFQDRSVDNLVPSTLYVGFWGCSLCVPGSLMDSCLTCSQRFPHLKNLLTTGRLLSN